MNVAELEPAGILTEAGTFAAALPLDNFTVSPPVAASPLRLTVPVEFVPPLTADGLTLSNAREAGEIVSAAVREAPLSFPEMVAVV